jgi:protein-disulfide isomerase
MSSKSNLLICESFPSSVARAIRGFISGWRRVFVLSSLALCLSSAVTAQGANIPEQLAQTSPRELGSHLAVGDVIFIRVSALPFKKVASATESWTNHVGVVIDVSGKEPLIGESTFPFSKATPLSRFVARSTC